MYLKRIEVKGFKSFADKIDLEFGRGITAIVGPNGSGKSNISDSIRWVLGEQSAKALRGSKMEDVIFAGTENRKGLGCAEVSLTIDNTNKMFPLDYAEITVTRRLYKSGESEYLINGTQCRLRDITELFMDTGIGIDGYSLVGQGKIDEILSTKSEDRRNLFEEAAGIVKYKTRKYEAEKKLENTKQNLIRIVDIINGLEEQIEPLKGQSSIAKKFLSLRDELKELEINVILHSYENAKGRLINYINEIENLEKSKGQYEQRKDEIISSIAMLKESLSEIEREYEEKNARRIEIEKNYESIQGSLNLLRERKENLQRERERILKESTDEGKVIEKLREEYELIRAGRLAVEEEVQKHRQMIEEFEEEYNRVNSEAQGHEILVESKKSDLLQIIKDISDINNKISSSRLIIENLSSRKSQLDKEMNLKLERMNSLNNEIDNLQKSIDAYDREIEMLKQKAQEISRRIAQLEQNEERLKKENNSCFERLKTLEARHRTLKDMDKDMEGFNRAVKAVILRYKDGKRVFGTISDLIEVPEGYEVALEIALGSSMQNIVVDNENTAGMLIEYLKTNSIGRATFLPLTTIKGREVHEGAIKKNILGYLGPASDIVSYDAKYKNAVTNLLGRILICDNLNSAKLIARETDYNYRIVTLDGDVINAGGSFTGGSNNVKTSGVFTRRNEIEELNKLIIREKEKLKKIVDDIYVNSQEINVNKEELNNLNIKIMDAVSGRNHEFQKLESIKREITGIEESIRDINIELQQIEIESSKSTDAEKSSNSTLQSYIERQQELEEEIEALQYNNKTLREARDELMNRLTQQKVVYAEKFKSLEAIDNDIKRIEKDKNTIELKIEYYKKQIQDIDIKCSEVDQKRQRVEEDAKRAWEDTLKIREDSCDIDTRKKEISASILTKEEQAQDTEDSIKDITASIHKIDLLKSKLESEMEMYTSRIWDDYEISIAQAAKYRRDIGSMAEANRRVAALKAEIKELGDVNIGSIEEYKRVTERYDFLSAQRDDLIKAEQSLVDIIDEIDRKMREQFNEKFRIIRQNFNQTFRELFGGGYADLRLENDDILNCGIDIIVEPPGKKHQSLTLLSGGERGLAAIALLFAILRMKPTPFCILDEIEAALDDANVNRFAGFLKDYSQNTQFIMITHRKGSMAAADALYGVTMEEKGVSKVISLKLKGGN